MTAIGGSKEGLDQAGRCLRSARSDLYRNPEDRPPREYLLDDTTQLLSRLMLNLGLITEGVGEDQKTIEGASSKIKESQKLVSAAGAAAISEAHNDLLDSTTRLHSNYGLSSETYLRLRGVVEQLVADFGSAQKVHKRILREERELEQYDLPIVIEDLRVVEADL